jgi:peptide-methionine (S)-S-oxide reductase
MTASTPAHKLATLGGGCFWCLEAAFNRVEGVIEVRSGYSGGRAESATYDQVSTGDTGHAEVVQIEFDPGTIPFEEVLDIFFTIHDPTTLNRQGADIGPQYRSVIFYHDERQRAVAEKKIRELERSGKVRGKITTALEPFTAFYKAEPYHDDYYERNSGQAYCRLVIAPKISKLEKEFGEDLRKGA